MKPMSPETHRELEREIEDAIARTVEASSLKLPLGATPETMHLMAKAAVTVYEAAVLEAKRR